ncbi:hypothetical protein PPOLYM_00592 [Paenibacillus polymyxa]|nr:hypothetical protein PPOLYM_00592 [Paenibacillus polymyxa]
MVVSTLQYDERPNITAPYSEAFLQYIFPYITTTHSTCVETTERI